MKGASLIASKMPIPDITGFILAGGKSTRMGADKAFLRLGEMTLLEHAIGVVETVAEQVWLVGDHRRLSPYGMVVEDRYPECGPLGGIHAALSATQTEWNLILGVDTPFVTERFLRYLAEAAQENPMVVTVPRIGAFTHPLCAIYRRGFVQYAEEALEERQLKIRPLIEVAGARVIAEPELNEIGESARMFDNLNTPEDWQRAQQAARTRSR